MEQRFAEAIAGAAGDAELPVRLITDYGGRGMGNEGTAALGYEGGPGTLAAAAVWAVAEGHFNSHSETEDLMVALSRLRSDNLGRSQVVY